MKASNTSGAARTLQQICTGHLCIYAMPCPAGIYLQYSQLLNACEFHAAEIFLLEPKGWEGKSCVDLFYRENAKEGMVKLRKTTAKKPVGLFI